MNIHLHLSTLEQHGAMDHNSHVYSIVSYEKTREAQQEALCPQRMTGDHFPQHDSNQGFFNGFF